MKVQAMDSCKCISLTDCRAGLQPVEDYTARIHRLDLHIIQLNFSTLEAWGPATALRSEFGLRAAI